MRRAETASSGNVYALSASGVRYPALVGASGCDVVVIGAGITGLSTALHLARAGRSVTVLERDQPGFGASGRNGGQVNPGLKTDPETVLRDFGALVGERLVEAAWGAPDVVFDLISHYRLACDAVQGGTLQAATAGGQCAPLRALLAQGKARNWPVTWLDSAAMAERTGSAAYCGGMLDARGGQLDPLAYTRGLAGAVLAEGGRVFGESRVVSIRRAGDGWQVRTEAGQVMARRVLVATNGYSGRVWNALRRSVVPVYSAIVASEVLPERLRARLLASREVAYELGRITTYYRVDASGRLLMGGRSASREATGPAAFRALIRRACYLWPETGRLAWTHGWNGQLAVTLDHYPHWHNPQPGLYAVLGYNGRGVAMATVAGREIARYFLGEAPPLFPFTPVRPVRLHGFWKAGVAARVIAGRAADRLGWP